MKMTTTDNEYTLRFSAAILGVISTTISISIGILVVLATCIAILKKCGVGAKIVRYWNLWKESRANKQKERELFKQFKAQMAKDIETLPVPDIVKDIEKGLDSLDTAIKETKQIEMNNLKTLVDQMKSDSSN
jgi:hypothetical protein